MNAPLRSIGESETMPEQVLVTGGTGFLGEHVVRALLAHGGYSVRVLARSPSPVLAELDVQVVNGDVLEGHELAAALAGCAGVFHLAGFVSRDADAHRMMRVHVEGTRR